MPASQGRVHSVFLLRDASVQEWGCKGTHLGRYEDRLAGHWRIRDVIGILHDLYRSQYWLGYHCAQT